jgi:excisionase family DNA binding protein
VPALEPELVDHHNNRIAPDREYLTVPEVQRLLRVGRSVVYQSIANGSIKSVRIGRLIRIPRSAISA